MHMVATSQRFLLATLPRTYTLHTCVCLLTVCVCVENQVEIAGYYSLPEVILSVLLEGEEYMV